MSSPYGPSGGQDPQQQWGQQPYGGGNPPGTPSGGFPQQGGYPQQPQSPYPPEQGQYGYQQQSPYQPTQQQPQPGQPQPTQQYPNQPQGYGPPTGQQAAPFGQYNPNQPLNPNQPQGGPGGLPPGYPGAPPAKKRGGAGIWIAVVVVVLLVGAFAVTAFVTPGFLVTKVFDQGAVQDGVKGVLTGKYSVADVESVSCPADQEVKKDARFSCKVTIGGQEKTVNITVRSDDGEYEVAPPLDN
ncbi:DUF4333 domain-containing protein [Actinokineospora bangkokensis]|uniref:DUF4333 domain-containing protein n=1 Tax=Actinokineospora bangkokensis TaxID=1193682 RepID=A0A1Q9LN66_9PSEU|nr:DUF4333 domain-containing protein [Actinokineospora bangkokensis]OLR93439.1 hypothetical protein BJP25_14100 [Actinokineospora bangkokensis]